MKKIINVQITEDCLWLTDDVVYSQQPKGKGGSSLRQMHLSIIHPQNKCKSRPCIIWLAGGGWRHQEQNAYIPDFVWLAKRGYIMAFVEYTCNELHFPAHIEQIKEAIRYLRSDAGLFGIDPDNIGIMGASAGAHLAAMTAVTNGQAEYEKGSNLEQSSAVKAACTWYLPSDLFRDDDPEASYTQQLLLGFRVEDDPERGKKACPALLVDHNTPPFLLLHGTADRRVSCKQSEEMYEALQKNGIPAELYLLDGAPHGGLEFLQQPVNDLIGDFFDRYLKTSASVTQQ